MFNFILQGDNPFLVRFKIQDDFEVKNTSLKTMKANIFLHLSYLQTFCNKRIKDFCKILSFLRRCFCEKLFVDEVLALFSL